MYAKGKANSVPSDAQAQEKLALYVYEYLMHVGATKAAQSFLSEIRWEKNITLGESPGFLCSWWCVFWDLYCAAPERRDNCEHTSEAKAFHDYGFVNTGYPGGMAPHPNPQGGPAPMPPSEFFGPGGGPGPQPPMPVDIRGPGPGMQRGGPGMPPRLPPPGAMQYRPRPPGWSPMGPCPPNSGPYSAPSPSPFSGGGGGPPGPGTPGVMPSPQDSNASGDSMYAPRPMNQMPPGHHGAPAFMHDPSGAGQMMHGGDGGGGGSGGHMMNGGPSNSPHPGGMGPSGPPPVSEFMQYASSDPHMQQQQQQHMQSGPPMQSYSVMQGPPPPPPPAGPGAGPPGGGAGSNSGGGSSSGGGGQQGDQNDSAAIEKIKESLKEETERHAMLKKESHSSVTDADYFGQQ